MLEHHPEDDWRALSVRLRRVALALCRDPHEADDLVQQTLARLLTRNPERVTHAGYARKTMMNLWLDNQRSLKRRVARLRTMAMQGVTRRDDPVERMSSRERSRVLEHAIRALPPRQRAVITLRLVEELDTNAIAETLGCSKDAVRSNLHQARRHLRESMCEGGDA